MTPALQREPSVRPAGSGRLWILLIMGLIAMNVAIVTVTVLFARGDPSAATEPNYYAKALRFGDTIQLRQASARLGWSAAAIINPARPGEAGSLVVTLLDRDRHPVDGARVEVVAFASARANTRLTLTLAPTADAGAYAAPLSASPPGQWHLSLVASRGEDRFLSELDISAPAPVAY